MGSANSYGHPPALMYFSVSVQGQVLDWRSLKDEFFIILMNLVLGRDNYSLGAFIQALACLRFVRPSYEVTTYWEIFSACSSLSYSGPRRTAEKYSVCFGHGFFVLRCGLPRILTVRSELYYHSQTSSYFVVPASCVFRFSLLWASTLLWQNAFLASRLLWHDIPRLYSVLPLYWSQLCVAHLNDLE